MFLGAKLHKTMLHNGLLAQAMSPTKYVREAMRNCAAHLSYNYGGKYRIPKKADNPFKMGFDPELDTSMELDQDALSYYRMSISIIRWIIELGRNDTITKESSLLSYIALLREGHLEAAVHVMVHVGQQYNSILVYDPSYPEVDHSVLRNVIGPNFIGMP